MFDHFSTYFELGFWHFINLKMLYHLAITLLLLVPFDFKQWKKVWVICSMLTLGHFFSMLFTNYHWVVVKITLTQWLIPITILTIGLFNYYFQAKKNNSEHALLAFVMGILIGVNHYFTNLPISKFLAIGYYHLGIGVATISIALAYFTLNHLIGSMSKTKSKSVQNIFNALAILYGIFAIIKIYL